MKPYIISSFITLAVIGLMRFYPSKEIAFWGSIALFLVTIVLTLVETFGSRSQIYKSKPAVKAALKGSDIKMILDRENDFAKRLL